MKILMVTRERDEDRLYGLGKSLNVLCSSLQSLGYNVVYLSQSDVGDTSLNLINRLSKLLSNISINPNNLVFFRAFAERINMGRLAAMVASKNKFTHIHLHDPWIAFGYRFFCHLYGIRPLRWGITEHGYGCYSRATLDDGLKQSTWLQRMLRRLEYSLLQRADWCIFPTQAALTQTARDLCVDDIPITWNVIPHAIPPLNIISKNLSRKKLGWINDGIYVLSVGRLVHLKGFDLVLKALAMLPSEWRTQAIILGGGDSSNLRGLALKLNIPPPIILTAIDVGLYLSAADVYVSASSTESFGLANLEAMYAGLPCVLTATPAVTEVVGTGVHLVSGQAEAIAAALFEILTNSTRASNLSNAARARATGWPSTKDIALNYVKCYQTLES